MKKFLLFMLICCIPNLAKADTVINATMIQKPTTWTLLKSPYIIEGNVNIGTLGSITVEPGVKILFKNGYLMSQGGKIFLKGTAEKEILIDIQQESSSPLIQGLKSEMHFTHVSFTGMNRPFINAWDRSKIYLDHVSYIATSATQPTWLSVFGSSTVEIDHLLLSGWKGTGIELFENASLLLRDSDLLSVNRGVNIFGTASSTMTGNVFASNATAIYANTSNLFISKNDFENNRIHIDNISSAVQSPNNWWGSALTPKTYTIASDIPATDIGVLVGDIVYSPISLDRHRKSSTCCSSVLFFPGLMGSRLYVKSLGLENQLWEPNRNADVKKLFLNAAGESVLAGIYTKDIINRTNIAFGTPYIDQSPYKGFSTFMDTLVKDKVISAWKSVPYDWRFTPDTLLNMTDVELENSIVSLSQKSKTKKVTLLSHSNGGMVIKQLMIRLKAVQMEHLIDKIIFVALPEYGTPQAITSLLFGHEQSIAGGLILKSSVAKDLGQNMPTAYTLLPSDAFFMGGGRVQLLSDEAVAGSTLRTFLRNYTHTNTVLLNKASELHTQLDAWISPVPVFQIVGTGLPTVQGLQRVDGDNVIPAYTNTGDSVVLDMFNVSLHSFNRSGTTVAVDLTQEQDVKHMTIMNAVSVQNHISSLVRDGVFGINGEYDIHRLPLSYKIAKVTATSSSNLLLTNDSTTNAYDIYKHALFGNFDYIDESNNQDRYELFDGSVLYLNLDSLEKFAITQQSSGNQVSSVDIDLFEREGEILNQSHFSDVPVNPSFAVSISGAVLAVKINRGMTINIYPDKETSLDVSGNVISQVTATTTRDRNKEAVQVRTQMIRGVVSDALRKRYLTRLDAYAATGDIAYLMSTRTRIDRAVASITRFDANPALRARYANLKLDYQLLAYLFYYMSPDRPAQMQFVSS